MAPPPTLLSPSELSYLHTSLASIPPIRPDARSPTSFRPLVAETDLLPSANGSARLCFADGTEAIVGVKAEIEKHQAVGNDRWYDNMGEGASGEDEEMGDGGERDIGESSVGEDKWIEVVVEMPGQRDDDTMVVFLAQMIHEGLVADGALRNRLVINARWHWRLYIDVRTSLFLSLPTTHASHTLSLQKKKKNSYTKIPPCLTNEPRSSSSPPPTPTPSPSSP